MCLVCPLRTPMHLDYPIFFHLSLRTTYQNHTDRVTNSKVCKFSSRRAPNIFRYVNTESSDPLCRFPVSTSPSLLPHCQQFYVTVCHWCQGQLTAVRPGNQDHRLRSVLALFQDDYGLDDHECGLKSFLIAGM